MTAGDELASVLANTLTDFGWRSVSIQRTVGTWRVSGNKSNPLPHPQPLGVVAQATARAFFTVAAISLLFGSWTLVAVFGFVAIGPWLFLTIWGHRPIFVVENWVISADLNRASVTVVAPFAYLPVVVALRHRCDIEGLSFRFTKGV